MISLKCTSIKSSNNFNLAKYVLFEMFSNVTFSLEDRTIALLIKRRNEFFEEKDFPVDDDFELLSALFFEQAYPHRGAEELDAQDFLLD